MEVIINGEAKHIEPMSVMDLLRLLGIDSQRVAVELNLDILAKGAYASTGLNEGDRLEIVHFVGGG